LWHHSGTAERVPIDPAILTRLKSQTERAGLVLFTGAGFSWDAKDRRGQQLPTVAALKNELWQLCFPNEPFDATASIGDVYEVALNSRKPGLSELMASRLSVDAASLPDYYKTYFDFPWLSWKPQLRPAAARILTRSTF